MTNVATSNLSRSEWDAYFGFDVTQPADVPEGLPGALLHIMVVLSVVMIVALATVAAFLA